MATRLNARRGAQQRHSAVRQNAVNATCDQPTRVCHALATRPNTRRGAHQRHNAVRRNAVSATCDRPRADGARAQQATGPPRSGGLLCAGASPRGRRPRAARSRTLPGPVASCVRAHAPPVALPVPALPRSQAPQPVLGGKAEGTGNRARLGSPCVPSRAASPALQPGSPGGALGGGGAQLGYGTT